jgi:hypothetical protein
MDNNIILVFALIIAILMLISFLSSKPSVAETFLSSCTGNIYNPGCLRDLNDWARDLAPKTSLNRYCENKDALNQDLVPGQYCVANCKFGKPFWKGSKWIPGGKIFRTKKGFEWEKGPGYRVPMNGTNLKLTKKGYCEYV